MTLESIIKKTGKYLAKKAIIPLSFLCLAQPSQALFEKNPIIMPLGSVIEYSVQASQGTKFSGDSIEASFIPEDKPYQNIRGQYQLVEKGNSLTGAWIDKSLTESNGEYKIQLDLSQTSAPGDYYFRFNNRLDIP